MGQSGVAFYSGVAERRVFIPPEREHGLIDCAPTTVSATTRFIGRRLVTLLHRAGAQPVRSTWIFFGACAGEAQFPGLVENMIGVIVSAREYMLQEDLIEAASFDGAVAELWRWSARPDAALWYSMCWAEGRAP